MSKINTTTLMRRKRRYLTKDFTDPDVPGQTLTLTLCSTDILLQSQANDLAEALWLEYGPDEDGDQKHFEMFAEDAEPILLNLTFLKSVAVLCVAQGGPASDRYGADEMIALALGMEKAWNAASQWYVDLCQGKSEGNSLGAGEGSSSAPASPNTSSTSDPSSGEPKPNGSLTSRSEPSGEFSVLTT